MLTWLIDRADASAFLIVSLALGVLGGPTLGHWLGRDPVSSALIIAGSASGRSSSSRARIALAYLCVRIGRAVHEDEDWP